MRLAVRLTPRAAHDRIDAIAETPEGWRVEARVRAVPEKGLANEALLRLLADELALSRAAIALSSGSKAREKRVQIDGDETSLSHALRAHPRFNVSRRS